MPSETRLGLFSVPRGLRHPGTGATGPSSQLLVPPRGSLPVSRALSRPSFQGPRDLFSHSHSLSRLLLLLSPLWALPVPQPPLCSGTRQLPPRGLEHGPLCLGPFFLHSHLFSNPAEFCPQNPASSSPVCCFSERGYHLNALHHFDKCHVSRPSVAYDLS